MIYAERAFKAVLQRRALVQALLIAITAVLFSVIMGFDAVVAALFGGIISVVNTLLQLWQLQRSGALPSGDAGSNLGFLMRCAAERFFLTLLLFVLGLGVIKLEPLPLLSGFVVGQLALIYGGNKKWI